MSVVPSLKLRIHRALRDHPFFLTHHAAAHLENLHYPDLGVWKDVHHRELRADREVWREPAEVIAAMSMRDAPKDAGRAILRHIWPNRNSEPEGTYTCALIAAEMVQGGMGWTSRQAEPMRAEIRRVLEWERRDAERKWDDRLIASYLKIKGLSR